MSDLELAQQRSFRRRPPRRHGPRLLMLALAACAAVATLAVVCVAYLLWPRWPAPPLDANAPAIPITIAGLTFNIPPAAIRAPVQRHPGTYERIDLSFSWPSLEPPDPNPKPSASAQTGAHVAMPTAAALERIFVSIAASGSSLPPAERVLTIYPRYTAAEASAGPGGLTVLAFRDGTPYQGEDLIYDAEAPGFLVRCTRRAGAIPGTCLYEQWIETVKFVFRFPRDWLDDWHFVAGNIERLIAGLRSPRN
jgi:hypothetical protein